MTHPPPLGDGGALSREKKKLCQWARVLFHRGAPASDQQERTSKRHRFPWPASGEKCSLQIHTHTKGKHTAKSYVCVCVEHHFAGMGPQGRAFLLRLLGRIWVVRNEESSGNDR